MSFFFFLFLLLLTVSKCQQLSFFCWLCLELQMALMHTLQCVCVEARRWAAPGHINSSSTGSVCVPTCVCVCWRVSFISLCVCVHVHTRPLRMHALQWPMRTPHTIFSLGEALCCVAVRVCVLGASLLYRPLSSLFQLPLPLLHLFSLQASRHLGTLSSICPQLSPSLSTPPQHTPPCYVCYVGVSIVRAAILH